MNYEEIVIERKKEYKILGLLYFRITRVNEKKMETIITDVYADTKNVKKWMYGNNSMFEFHDDNVEAFANYTYTIVPYFKVQYKNKELIINQTKVSAEYKNTISKYACFNNKHPRGRYSLSGMTQNQIFADLSRKRLIKKQ